MKEIALGDRRYRVIATEQRNGEWLAHAERVDIGDRFGLQFNGTTEHEAIDRVVQWLDWQHEHATALEALQQAEQAYHRTVTGSAFADPLEGPTAIELQKESLDQVEAARRRLDEVRQRRPE
jgi:hypothetical protein